MANSQSQRTGSGREIALLVGVLLLVAAGSVVTYWVRSEDAEASGQTAAATTTAPAASSTPAPAPRPRTLVPTPSTGEVVHADIYFDFKSTRLRADAAQLLQEKAGMMEHASTWGVLIQGYADRQGPPEYNRALAQRRATAVKQFLVELGVPEPSIKVVTIGQEGALCDEPSAECQQLNRRVHLEIRKLTPAAAAPVRPALLVGDTIDTQAGRGQLP
jgi:outer membrane protein OmpA-like peptidoglycan-associated protein